MPQIRIAPILTVYPPSELIEAKDREEAHDILIKKWDAIIEELIIDGKLPKKTGKDNSSMFICQSS